MSKVRLAMALTAALALGGVAQAQDLPRQSFKVVGSFGNLSNWSKVEKSYWTEEVAKSSKGQITATAQSTTELNSSQRLKSTLRNSTASNPPALAAARAPSSGVVSTAQVWSARPRNLCCILLFRPP